MRSKHHSLISPPPSPPLAHLTTQSRRSPPNRSPTRQMGTGRKGDDPVSLPFLCSVDTFHQKPTSTSLALRPCSSPRWLIFHLGSHWYNAVPYGLLTSNCPPTQCCPLTCGNVQTSSLLCGRQRRLRAEPQICLCPMSPVPTPNYAGFPRVGIHPSACVFPSYTDVARATIPPHPTPPPLKRGPGCGRQGEKERAPASFLFILNPFLSFCVLPGFHLQQPASQDLF